MTHPVFQKDSNFHFISDKCGSIHKKLIDDGGTHNINANERII